MAEPPTVLQCVGADLRLDDLRCGDAMSLFRYRADPQISRYQGWCPATPDEAERFIDKASRVLPATPDSWYQRAIRLRDGGELIGDLGVHFGSDEHAPVEIGISLAPAWQGKGLASQALELVLGYVFDSLGRHRVIGSVDPRNAASIRLLERAGMRREAHFRQSLWLGGEWVDDMVFAMLAHEWRQRQASAPHHG